MKTAAELIDLLGGTTTVARSVGVRSPSVHEWRARGIPGDKLILLATDIERASNFEIRRWHLRPGDWHRIWPELLGTEGAPAGVGSERGAWEMAPEGEGTKSASTVTNSPADPSMLYGGRRDGDHVSDFGVVDNNGPDLAAEIYAVGHLVGDTPKREASDAA